MANHGHRWTTDEYQQLIGMWLRNESSEKICEHFGVKQTGLNMAIQRLRKNGIPLPLRKVGHKPERYNKPWTQEEVETVVRMRNDRISTSEIALAIDRSFYAVQGIILKLRNQEGVPVISLGSGRRRLWDADRLRSSVAGRNLIRMDEWKAKNGTTD